ncbi:hypothetical protein AB6N48_23015 [Salmonella enterica subsp. enterica serovar Infantis]|uniref:Uncharacterized protein n=1 Tax=Escherichia coli TaxID=562 RepID=A0A8T5YDC1_ECOLX|nr:MULTISPECIES: hypothetical protein [Enterobacteriaceae]EBV4158121.1 hypothetical protein [Salmonella enterica subsp. enterica serovar Agona]EJA5792869.1 hypothetical protein [Salmonella enterica]HBM2881751.1 hypothetical protein [Klebsiella oxytoca]HBR0320298.1 hypothetical protein [Klebsiella quasipneumoniae]HBU8303270.1 hypothetical protein [Klebsiella pneumoniae]
MELYFNNMRKAYDTLISAIRTDEMVQAVIKRQDSLVKIMEKASSVFQEQQLTGKKRILQNDNDLALTITNIGVETNFKEINYYRNLVSDTLLFNLGMKLIFSEIEQRYDTLFGSLRSYEKGDFEFHYKVYKTITDDQRSYLRDVSGNSLSILEMYLDKTKTKREYSKDKIELALSRIYDSLCVYYGNGLYDTKIKREGAYEYE